MRFTKAKGRDTLENNQLRRRDVLAALASLSALAWMTTEVSAQVKRIVVCNWGGEMLRSQAEAWGKTFTAKTGIPVEFDGSGPTFGKIRTMVDSGHVVWDVCDANLAVALDLGRRGLLEKIDWTKVDRTKIQPEASNDYGVSHFVYSFVLAYDKTKFGDSPPKSWADFWNLKNFPGGRALSARTLGSLEAALMADGIEAKKTALYPIDEKRALAKIAEIRKSTVFWKTGAESQQLLRQGEVSMGLLWNTRASSLRKESKSRIDYTFNQGLMIPAGWVVPKGNPAGSAVFDFIAHTQLPETQIELLRLEGLGPANPAASAMVPKDLIRDNPTDAQNIKLQAVADSSWIADNQDRVYNDYIKVISA